MSAQSNSGTTWELGGHAIAIDSRVAFGLPTANLYSGVALDMPVEVVRGAKPGPVLLVCAAVHGDELNGTEIIRRLRHSAALQHLQGTLILVPAVNLFGFVQGSRYLPDRRDLNRSFPGSKRGSMAARLAHVFFSELVTHADYIVDLHTAAVHRENIPQVRAAMDEPGVAALAIGFGIPLILNSKTISKSLRREAGKRSIPTIAYEAGEALRLDEMAIVTGLHGITNLMRSLGMVTGSANATTPPGIVRPHVAESSSWVRAHSDGTFRPLVKLGVAVSKGEVLGVVSPPFGGPEALVKAPFSGIVVCTSKLPLVNAGEALMHIAKFEKLPAVADDLAAHAKTVAADRFYATAAVEPAS